MIIGGLLGVVAWYGISKGNYDAEKRKDMSS
jgi:hypothetical protein